MKLNRKTAVSQARRFALGISSRKIFLGKLSQNRR
jgi:hypothetical protein